MVGVSERESHQQQIHEQRQDREQDPNRIHEDEERGEQRWPGDQRHSEGHHSKRFARVPVTSAQIQELAHSDAEQNQAARHLKIRDRDPERTKDDLAEKNEPNRNSEARNQPECPFMLPALGLRIAPQPEKNGDEPDWVDGHKKRDKREEEFFDVGLHLRSDSSSHVTRFCAKTVWLRFPFTGFAFSNMFTFRFFSMKPLLASLLFGSLAIIVRAEDLKTADAFRGAAAKANSILTLPDWDQTPEAVDASMKAAIATANAALDQIGKQDLAKVTFKSTIVALDDLGYQAHITANKATIIKETNTSAAMRTAGENAVKLFQDWTVGIDYREDVYKAIKAFEKTSPKLSGEDAKLLKETLRDYRRAGLDLPPEKRQEVEKLRKDLAKLGTDFDSNIVEVQAPVVFTKAELDGVPDSFLASPGIQTSDDAYTVKANVTWQTIAVLDNAKSEEVRKRLYIARDSLAKEKNVTVLNQMLSLRNKIALRLGYKSWADFQTEIKMAKSAAGAEKYINDLVSGSQPKFEAEVAELRKLKVAETKDSNAQINVWDYRYYQNQLKKQKYEVDTEALRVYFPFQKTLEGMFNIYQSIFGLKFEKIAVPQKWVDDLQLYAVSDAATGEPLGMFYLDMFPREGKFNHFAEFEIIGGKLLPDGKYQRPTVALLCNFPPPSEGKPSLLTHGDVETLFHEFGHALHTIVTRAKYSRFAGTNVPGDFVEAPSQMLQSWVWDKKVLDTFAADYSDPAKKISAETINKMMDAKLATVGVYYRRQFAFASLDLALHAPHPEDQPYDSVAISNPILEKVFLPISPETTFVSYFGHLNGYDAGYYGYAWADAIAADMATIFESAKDGYLDKQAGLRLRHDIYEPGDSRDITQSIEKFLGRKQSVQPFLKKIGIGGKKADAGPSPKKK
jgi:thimet oligopeptidase